MSSGSQLMGHGQQKYRADIMNVQNRNSTVRHGQQMDRKRNRPTDRSEVLDEGEGKGGNMTNGERENKEVGCGRKKWRNNRIPEAIR